MPNRIPIILIAILLATVTPARATASPVTEWTPVVPAVPGATASALQDVAATSPADVWVLGGGSATHWDGTAWSPLPALEIPGFDVTRLAIDAVPAEGLWVAGHRRPVGGEPGPRDEAVVARFDGTAWTVQPTPPPAEGTAYFLKDIDMVTVGEGWAVGHSFTCCPSGTFLQRPLIFRWHNGQWTQATLPAIANNDVVLEAVHARSSSDVWAVGRQGDTVLIMHWDGVQWNHIASPPTETYSQLLAVTAISATDVWAVGGTCFRLDDHECRPFALRLSGGTWQVVPTAGDSGDVLVDVVARSVDDVWAVGYNKPAIGFETNHIEHWDGQSLSTVPAGPAPVSGSMGTASGLASALSAVTVIPGSGELWAVGWVMEEISADINNLAIRHD